MKTVYLNFPENHPSRVRILDILHRADVAITDSFIAAEYMIEPEGCKIKFVNDPQRRFVFFNPQRRQSGPTLVGSHQVNLETGMVTGKHFEQIPFKEFWESLVPTMDAAM